MNVKERFESKFSVVDGDCWKWHGTYARKEYGDRPMFWMHGKPRLSARVAWTLYRGEIPAGKMICHLCNHAWCVNPAHLYVGDQASNMRDRDAAGHTSKWDHRYNFVQTPELEKRVQELRATGMRIDDVCATLNIGRSTFYRLRARGVIDAKADRAISRQNYANARR